MYCSAEDRREYLESLLRESKKEEVASVLEDEALNYYLARRYSVCVYHVSVQEAEAVIV